LRCLEFAFEIGSGLLTEVRRLQSLLAERDKAIQDIKEEKDDLEKTVESLRTALRQQEQSADKFKEENWNLEVTLQELRTQLVETQGTTQRLEGEQKRLAKLLTTTREAVDHHKNEAERHQNAFVELKAKHETDVAQARRHAASLQRDKSDLQQTVDSLKAEAAKASRRLPRFGTPLTPNGALSSAVATPAQEEDDVFSNAASTNRKKMDNSAIFPPDGFENYDSSPEQSPSRPFLAPNHPTNEIEALQQRLAHAQRQINTLKGSLQREKELRIEYKRKLESTPARDEQEKNEEQEGEDMFPPVEEQAKQKPRLTPFRVGRGGKSARRGRGGLTLFQRLAGRAPAPEHLEDGDDFDAAEQSSPPPLPPLNLNAATEDEDQPADGMLDEDENDEESELQRSPSSRLASASNRASVASVTSIEGMDPAFANILRRSTSGRSISHGSSSPLRHSLLSRSARARPVSRRNRGGAAFQEARPPSFAGQPEALANELGQLGLGNLEDTFELPETTRETTEIACQTDFEEQAPMPVPQVIVQSPTLPELPLAPSASEMGIQVDPEPVIVPSRSDVSSQTEELEKPAESEPIVPPSKSDASLQTDEPEKLIELPAPIRIDSAVQHEDLTPRPVMISSGMSTDPLPTPEPVPVPVSAPEPIRVSVSASAVQTDPARMAHADVQTAPEVIVVKHDMDTQTPPPAAISEAQIQTSAVSTTDADVQVAVQVAEASVSTAIPRRRSYADMSVGDSSGDTTFILGLARGTPEDEDDVDIDDARTETGTHTETDLDDYVDARDGMPLATPMTESSMDDYHSILTVTDNDFSESDEESIKASRLPSRQGMSRIASSSQPSPVTPSSPSPPPRTYESVAVSCDILQEKEEVVAPEDTTAATITPPAKPRLELKEISIQTDDWFPPQPTALSAPPSPAPASSPALYRVGPTSQQFQFISPPPSAGPTTSSQQFITAPSSTSNSTVRDIPASLIPTPIPRPRTSHSDRRQSIESTLSLARDEALVRSRTPSNVTPAVVDKSRPPMMVIPPPPRQPPPLNAMPPPNFIPEKRQHTSSTSSQDVPPPRPSSPPPPELIQRATTPTFGQVLSVPGTRPFGLRHHPSSAASSQGGIRQPPSTGSFRSGTAGRPLLSNVSALSHSPRERERREMSTTSLISGGHSMESQRSSISSEHMAYDQPSQRLAGVPAEAGRPAGSGGATDPAVIHAITQTMIGEFLYKYTRKTIGKGHGERRHKRFFWVHPYTRTLYWSSADPGSSNVSESSAKSGKFRGFRPQYYILTSFAAYVEAVRSVLDPNPMPPGIYQYSVVVSTPQREMKFTAPTKERHDIWINVRIFLLFHYGAVC
jgi:hypothetical protein